MTTAPHIAIVGGGPGGLMLARLLHLRGLKATVLERDTHAGERPQGGSLDLHADTGQRAMQLAGLQAEFSAAARPEHQGDRLYDQHGSLLFDHDGAGDDRPEIDRTVLRQILLDSLPPGIVRWGSKVEAITPSPVDGYQVDVDGRSERFDVVIGADGAWSRVRPLLTGVVPAYEGATFVELGFEVSRHPSVDALVGSGKMFAAGDSRLLIAQRNGQGHIRGYAGWRLQEPAALGLTRATPEQIRLIMREVFAGWAPSLLELVEAGDLIGVRPLYALPIGHRWSSRSGLTLLGDAAHLMSPFAGEGVNLALADAVDLADALSSTRGWPAVTDYEEAVAIRATPAAEGSAEGLRNSVSPDGVTAVLDHYRERVAA